MSDAFFIGFGAAHSRGKDKKWKVRKVAGVDSNARLRSAKPNTPQKENAATLHRGTSF
jgi:hypothetical protein